MIAIENLSKQYGSKQVLTDINVVIECGEVCGFMGDNGAGKTTLFRCIAGLERHNSVISSDFKVLKDHVGILLTEPFFIARITGREYIQMMCNARGKLLDNLDKRNIFSLPLDQYAAQYSTGMKKKLALTAILLQNNDIYILDEPFNGVDMHGNIAIAEIVRRLKQIGKTVLVSSHVFSTLSDICDKICVLKEGRLSQVIEHKDFSMFEDQLKRRTFSTMDYSAIMDYGSK